MTDTAIAGIEASMVSNAGEAEYHRFRSELQSLAKNGTLTAESLAIFTIVRVLLNQSHGEEDHEIEDRAVKKLTKAFTPITNKVKLANGRRRWDTLNFILARIEQGYFGQFHTCSTELNTMLKAITPRLRLAVRSLKFTAT